MDKCCARHLPSVAKPIEIKLRQALFVEREHVRLWQGLASQTKQDELLLYRLQSCDVRGVIMVPSLEKRSQR